MAVVNIADLFGRVPGSDPGIANDLMNTALETLRPSEDKRVSDSNMSRINSIIDDSNKWWFGWFTLPGTARECAQYLKTAYKVIEHFRAEASHVALHASKQIRNLNASVAGEIALKEQSQRDLAGMTVDRNRLHRLHEEVGGALQVEKRRAEGLQASVNELQLKVNAMTPELENLRPKVPALEKRVQDLTEEHRKVIVQLERTQHECVREREVGLKQSAENQEISKMNQELVVLGRQLKKDNERLEREKADLGLAHENNLRKIKAKDQQLNTLKRVMIFVFAAGVISSFSYCYLSNRFFNG